MTGAPMTSVLQLENVSSGYGSGAIIRNVDLAVGSGEVVALLGANGVGKSTTLRTISGLLSSTTGSVCLDGADITTWSPQRIARAGVAHVVEGRGVFGGLTVAEHFKLSPRGEHLDRDTAYDYLPALADLSERRAGLLSGGEQQMLALGRALARRPRLLLVDELSLGLAPVIVQRLLPAVRAYATSSGAAVLLVEQHVQLALNLADRGYVMSHGQITVNAQSEQLLADSSLIVASYLGDASTTPASGRLHTQGSVT